MNKSKKRTRKNTRKTKNMRKIRQQTKTKTSKKCVYTDEAKRLLSFINEVIKKNKTIKNK